MPGKDFLNSEILGGNVGIANRSGFREIGTDSLQKTEPSRHFFEAIPTAWAEPYFFSKAIEAGEPRSTKEWVTLFLLHYFGIIYVERFEKETLQREYDRDLWVGLENTYPFSQTALQRVDLLQTNDGAVVGATYPRVLFFPSRSRAGWLASADLQPYLEGSWLSWERAFHLHLGEATERQKFHNFLRGLAASLLETSFRQMLEAFCDANFGSDYQPVDRIGPDPYDWPTAIPETIDPEALLKAYPLRHANAQGGQDYFLVDDWPADLQSPWMRSKTKVGIAPNKYRRGDGNNLVALFAKRQYQAPLGDNDQVVSLRSLLTPAAYFCQVAPGTDFSTQIRGLHETRPRNVPAEENTKSFSLAPLKAKFLEHFPGAFNRLRQLSGHPLMHDRIEWHIPIQDAAHNWLELRWVTQMTPAPEMPFTSLMLYPPKVSPDWKFYSLYGVGDKAAQGRWHLIDEQGQRGDLVELDLSMIGEPGSQYASVLHASHGGFNRPKAMAYRDGADEEGGILFLKDEWGATTIRHQKDVVLAMDLGTSNCCLALKSPATTTEILKFSLTPLRLWGPPLQGELPGFVPLEWSGGKGFFTSILLSRKNDQSLPVLTPQTIRWEHWFKVDIPSLHQKIDDQVYRENRLDVEWYYHTNLKWGGGDNRPSPYRSLFLELALLYAHAEAFFEKGLKISRYVFTYPLSFSDDYEQGYEDALRHSLRRIRQHCYEEEVADQADNDKFELLLIDESTAIAKSMRLHGATGALELFIDVGGGTADIALRQDEEFLVLDSVRVAGGDFFRIAKRNFTEEHLANAKEFKQCLSEVLEDGKQEVPLSGLTQQLEGNLGIYYSARLSGIEATAFRDKEKLVLKRIEKQAGTPYFQRYRSMLFFEHILGYALVQACAAAVGHQLQLPNGLRLILAGNCWGLLMFAGFERNRQTLLGEAKTLLDLIKQQVRPLLEEEEQAYLDFEVKEVVLLGDEDLSKAKTSVARGAIEADEQDTLVADKAPYTGVNIPQLRIGQAPNKVEWRWCDRWSKATLEARFGRVVEIKTIEAAVKPDMEEPFDPLLAVFTAIGKLEPPMEDTLPPNVWRAVNSEIIRKSIRRLQIAGRRLTIAPLNHYLSHVLYPDDAPLDFLDELARVNGHFKNNAD
ncbi:MAG TPA: hypothetical protein VN256_06880 [Pyrinomonadaceae bacterium]|nr:hypothetical protein [Pyrinomonadaceae bacterium]